ncbi:RAN GTPase-activating protein 1-like [Rutidosis leptorrhynchoides]|uniref:RAN GTPase-activating protein 1-like n=1 Tax=Rutidosis leptorrhynchoides TaxID=125765 RepID=UPI003A9935A0
MDSTEPKRLHSIKLWPPSHGTRLVLVQRIVKNLTTPSILSRKYGLLGKEEAEEHAKQIESSAFDTANHYFENEPDGDGGSAVQLYAKESSKLMVEAVKRGPQQKTVQEPVFEPVTQTHETFFDISKGPRAFIEEDEAKELLKPLNEPGNKYTKICFSNRSFGLGSARVAAPILSSVNKQLTEVDLSDFIAGRPEEQALEVMTIFSAALKDCDLRYLNLSDNALGEKGVRAFKQLLSSQGNLEELYLMNDGISEEAAKAVYELVPSTKKLKILHFHNNMTGDEGAISIAGLVKESPVLEDFRCSSTRVGSEGGVVLSEALVNAVNLKKLDLRDNMFGVEAGIALSKGIPVFSNLTEVYLSYLNLEDEGTLALVDALKNSASALEVLDMAGNDITSEAASALAACLTSKAATLTKLNLSENELKDEGAIVIGNALKDGFERLTEVDLSTNGIRTAGARVLSQAVVGKPGFKLLNINANYLTDDGVDSVKEIFKNSPNVLGLLDDNDPEGEEYDDEDDVKDGDDNEDELGSKLKNLEIKQDEE